MSQNARNDHFRDSNFWESMPPPRKLAPLALVVLPLWKSAPRSARNITCPAIFQPWHLWSSSLLDNLLWGNDCDCPCENLYKHSVSVNTFVSNEVHSPVSTGKLSKVWTQMHANAPLNAAAFFPNAPSFFSNAVCSNKPSFFYEHAMIMMFAKNTSPRFIVFTGSKVGPNTVVLSQTSKLWQTSMTLLDKHVFSCQPQNFNSTLFTNPLVMRQVRLAVRSPVNANDAPRCEHECRRTQTCVFSFVFNC